LRAIYPGPTDDTRGQSEHHHRDEFVPAQLYPILPAVEPTSVMLAAEASF